MVQAKMMNEGSFEKFVKEVNSQGELIRTRQDEKQSVLNEYDKEKRRFTAGKISRATLTSSVVKTNAELVKLDASIRAAMRKSLSLSNRMNEALVRQEPKVFRVSETGIRLDDVKNKPVAKKKSAIKKSNSKKAPLKKSPAAKKSPAKKKATKTEIAKEMAAEKKLRK